MFTSEGGTLPLGSVIEYSVISVWGWQVAPLCGDHGFFAAQIISTQVSVPHCLPRPSHRFYLVVKVLGKSLKLSSKPSHLRSWVLQESLGTMASELLPGGGACGVGMRVKQADSRNGLLLRVLLQWSGIHLILAHSLPAALCHVAMLSIRKGASTTEEHTFNWMNVV